jgi:hypothetical protein
MTLDEAEQKILAHVLAVTDGVKIEYRDFYTSGAGTDINTHTYERATLPGDAKLSVVLEKDGAKKRAKVHRRLDAHTNEILLSSDRYPELLEWWDRAVKQSAEKRVIDFALSLS